MLVTCMSLSLWLHLIETKPPEMVKKYCFFFRTVVSNLAAGVLDPSVGTEVQIISSSETAQSQQAIFFGGYQNETITRYGMKYQS